MLSRIDRSYNPDYEKYENSEITPFDFQQKYLYLKNIVLTDKKVNHQ